MLQSFEEEGKAIEEVRQMREKEMQLMKEKRTLRRQMKAENVERVARMNEYQRMLTLKKIEDTEK
jgi:DNA-binding protein H-NS